MDAPTDIPGPAAAARSDTPVLMVRDLRVVFPTEAGLVRAVDGVSFSIGAGETLGIVGESGSGKSMTALAAMGLIDAPGRIDSGEIRFRGADVRRMSPGQLREMRGGDIAMVFQNPMTSLNPVLPISRQIGEAMTAHGRTANSAAGRAVELLGRMGIVAPERAVHAYPHEFSGGMRQRVVLAMGMSNEPALLLADEPTTALDVTIQAQILDLLRALNRDFGTAIVLISHDLGVIAGLCERVVVMYAGEVVEEGRTEDVLATPRHPYTRALMNAVPRLDTEIDLLDRRLTTIEGMPPDPLEFPPGCRFAPRCPFRRDICDTHPDLLPVGEGRLSRCLVAQQGEDFTLAVRKAAGPRPIAQPAQAPAGGAAAAVTPLVEIKGLVKHFRLSRGWFEKPRVVRAVDGVDFTIAAGETLGVVGESGCGKSTLGRLLLRIHQPDAGSIRFDGQEIARAGPAAIRPLRQQMQMVFQDPYSSLNPRMTAGDILSEPLRYHGITPTAAETHDRVGELLNLVGLSHRARDRYPHEFSGGQRQRVSIARALSLSPRFIVADEPISALDVNIQAQIINLMVSLQQRFHLTYMFIAHDLAVVRHISDRIMVLHIGQIAEIAPAAALFAEPQHPYTRYLISAVPVPDVAVERTRARQILAGESASSVDPPSGCRFRTRCPLAKPLCAETMPRLREVKPNHFVACHFPGAF
jgi:peptide/nickel transport system ATP-binding protein